MGKDIDTCTIDPKDFIYRVRTINQILPDLVNNSKLNVDGKMAVLDTVEKGIFALDMNCIEKELKNIITFHENIGGNYEI